MASPSFRLAVLNPGRTGFLALGTQLLLEWRLHAVAIALLSRRIDFCVLPGARFPQGVLLPAAFPYVWFGRQTSSWSSVGLFCRAELEGCVRPIEEFSEDRVLWVEIWANPVVDTEPAVILACCYPEPGGDV